MAENPYQSPLVANHHLPPPRQRGIAMAVAIFGGCLSAALAYWLVPPLNGWWLLPIGGAVGIGCHVVFRVASGTG